MVVKATFTNFKKVSGWTKGPRKPTTNTYSGTATEVKTALTSALNSITNIEEGEAITISVIAVNENS